MAEILKEWLSERLQRPITWEPSAFGDMMKNGLVVADVLLSYHVINADKHYLMRSGNDPADIRNNWQYIAQWLHELDINLQDAERGRIMEGNGSALLRMFYQLFLRLDRRDRTDFIKEERQKVSNLVEKLGHRFKVDRIPSEEDTFVDELSKPLLNEAHFIEWQRKKAEQVKDTYEYIRHKYSKMVKKIQETNTSTCFEPVKNLKLSVRDRKDMDKFALRHPCKFTNYSYEQLLDLEKKALEQKSSISSSDWAKNYMDNLFSRMNKKTDSEEFQKQLSNVLSGSIWDMSIAEEETKLDTELAKKVMKLSQFEKQMCTQLMETKQQSRNLFQNRAQAEKEFSEQRTQQFNQFLDNVKEKVYLQVTEIDLEKQRQNTLHKKLYAEKMTRKRQSYYEICYDTVLSLIDYSTKYGYFKKLLEGDIPNHFINEWKNLFYRQQPIFDIVDPIENILEKHDEGEMTPEVEEIIRLELDRQDALNSTEFTEYHKYTPPWSLELLIPNYNPESDERKYENLGMRILGHVVYTLLEIKYPYPPPRPPADLPEYTAKALLCGLPDRSITEQMQILLNARKIHVTRLETAINFCLRKFKREMVGCTDIDLSFDKFIANANEEQDKELIKLIKTEDDLTYKTSDLAVSLMLGAIAANTKQTQTPKTLPEEDISLSAAASLGRYSYEALNSGDTLTDHLLAAMVVEYLKDQDDINGFVLINYPNSYREAQILEETFLGIAPPDDWQLDDRDDVYLEESIIKHRKKEIDEFKDVRVSKLVDDPHKKKTDKPFESYFTCYINLRTTEDILQEVFIWDLNEHNSELIDRFYALLGLNYSMYYEIIDKELLAQICKYIIGDLMPVQSNDKLFGENVLSMLEFTTSEAKGARSKTVKPEVSSMSNDKFRERFVENSKMSNKLEVVIKSPSQDDLSEKELSVHEEMKSLSSLEDIKLLAGEEDWEYGDLPIVHPIGVALANCWIEAENVYIKDMTELFFAKRLQMNCLVPYARYIKDKMEQIITLPSNKQDIVSWFQKDYNNFENDWRDVNLVKNEWHCRVMELQNKLYHICDQRKLFAEKQRQLLICDNWAMEELTSMVNTYISCMQTELNRYVMTYQIFHDFYFAMIKHMPQNDRLSSKDLNKIYRDNDDASASGSKKGSEDKLYRLLKVSFQDMHLKNIEIDYSNNPFNVVIENNVKLALKIIKETNDTYRSMIAREYSDIAKIQAPVKKKEENASEESIHAEDIFRENALKCIDEWTMGINGEMFRANLRILALQYKCYRDMRLFNEHIYKTFTEIQNDIDTYYSNEIKSVDRLSKYFQLAVENGRKIPESLVLEHDKFIIDPNLLQYAQPEGPTVTEKPSETRGMNFSLSQLANLRSQFKIVSPSGIILQQAFIFLLQDFIFFGKESCAGSMFPEEWKLIDPEQLPKLVLLLFGDTVYVDWRDFLIYCLNLRFPTVEELLEVRKKFRCKDLDSTELISRDDFLEEELWFDADFDPECNLAQLRKNLVKHFLFELFETDEDIMNYSAFLLAFCKSVNPVEGFATALSMAVGKKTCYVLDECEQIVCKLIKNKKYKDACRACALKCSGQFLNILLNRVVNNCEAVAISELQYVAPVEEKNVKGKKGGKPAKKDISASARMSKISASTSIAATKAKVSLSSSNVKTTFICPPCGEQEPVEKEEKKEEKKKEEVEEEVKIELEKDPNLAYSVSQSAIWNVLRICLPWHFELLPETKNTPYVDQVTELLKRLESDTENGDIYVCRFVSDPNICKLLHKVKRFTVICLAEEIEKLY